MVNETHLLRDVTLSAKSTKPPFNVIVRPTVNPALGFRSLPRNLARGVLSGAVRLPEQRASGYFTRPRPGRKAAKPKPKMDAMNKRASVAVMSMEAKKMVGSHQQETRRRSEDEAILASLEAGRALSPQRPQLLKAAPGEGDGVWPEKKSY